MNQKKTENILTTCIIHYSLISDIIVNQKELSKFNLKESSDLRISWIIMSVGLSQAMVSLPCLYGYTQFAVWPVSQSVSKLICNHWINVGFCPLSKYFFKINQREYSVR